MLDSDNAYWSLSSTLNSSYPSYPIGMMPNASISNYPINPTSSIATLNHNTSMASQCPCLFKVPWCSLPPLHHHTHDFIMNEHPSLNPLLIMFTSSKTKNNPLLILDYMEPPVMCMPPNLHMFRFMITLPIVQWVKCLDPLVHEIPKI
jgi:hypothetical protein